MSKCPMCGTPATFKIRLPDGTSIPAATLIDANNLLRAHQRQWPNEDLMIQTVTRVEEYAVLLRAAATKMRDEFRKEFRSEQSVRERWDGYVDGFDSTEPTDAAYLALDAALATATPSTLSAETAGLATPHTLGVEGTNAQVLTVACPIGLDAHPEICSAGYCTVCKAAMATPACVLTGGGPK